jgi:hypothetical protein
MDNHKKRVDQVAKGSQLLQTGCSITVLYRYLHLRFTVNCKRGMFE